MFLTLTHEAENLERDDREHAGHDVEDQTAEERVGEPDENRLGLATGKYGLGPGFQIDFITSQRAAVFAHEEAVDFRWPAISGFRHRFAENDVSWRCGD